MVVSASGSSDLNKRPLRYHWVVLRGDPSRIQIKPMDKDGSKVELIVPWHDRRPIAEGSPMGSNRVDIGVFVHNGEYYSAPGFITFLFLDHEARTYEPGGRLLEIGYGVGESEFHVPDWVKLLELFKPEAGSLGAGLLKKLIPADQAKVLVQAAGEYKAKQDARDAVRKAREAAEKDKKPDAELKPLREAENKASKEFDDVLQGKARRPAGAGQRHRHRRASQDHRQPDVLPGKRRGDRQPPEGRRAEGPVGRSPQAVHCLGPLQGHARRGRRACAGPPPRQSGPGRADAIREGPVGAIPGGSALAVLPAGRGQLLVPCELRRSADVAAAILRDVYHYDAGGGCTGWTRYDGQQRTDFNAEGQMVLDKDARGRCVEARTVRYEQERPKSNPHHGPNWNPLRWLPGSEIVRYEYANDGDVQGRVVKREPVEEKKEETK